MLLYTRNWFTIALNQKKNDYVFKIKYVIFYVLQMNHQADLLFFRSKYVDFKVLYNLL